MGYIWFTYSLYVGNSRQKYGIAGGRSLFAAGNSFPQRRKPVLQQTVKNGLILWSCDPCHGYTVKFIAFHVNGVIAIIHAAETGSVQVM